MRTSKTTLFILSLCLLSLAGFQAHAQTLALRTSPRIMEGIRPMGMGGAFIAVDGSDENTLFYNPAAINDFEKKAHMQFLLPTVETSYKAISFISDDVMGLADDIDAAPDDAAKVDAFNAFTATHTGRYEEVNVHGSVVNFMQKYLAASIFYDNSTVVALTNPSSSTIDIEAVTQGGVQVGSAYSFFDDMFKVGAAVKFIERHMVDETITQRDIIANSDFGDTLDTDEFGFGVGFDAGIKAKLPIHDVKAWDAIDPTFAVTLQDIGDTRFSGNVGRTQESLTAGFALHPNFWKLKNNFVVDVRDLDHETDFITKLHAGLEFTYPELSKVLRTLSLRVGANQGYFAGGLGFDFRYFKLNAATWGREIGARTRQKESRMFGLQLAAGF